MTRKFTVASNPHRSKSSRPPAAKKGRTMAKAPKRRKANAGGAHRKASNKGKQHRRRRHNPDNLAAIVGSPKDLVTASVAGLASAVATRQIPQMVLGTSNSGMEGYAANIVTALVSDMGGR